jgi:hypothetical protein
MTDDDARIIVCRHCGRTIENDPEEGWIDRAAGYDDEDGDGIWRTTCDAHHDSITAEHEPFPQTEEEMLVCVHGRPVWVGNECGNCEADGYTWAPDCDRHDGPWGTDKTCERCTYDTGWYRPLDDKGPLGPGAAKKPVLTKDNLVLHTDAPLDMLCFMVAEHGLVASGEAAGHGGPDCIYGWAEPWDPEKVCKPHQLIFDLEPSIITVLADILVNLGSFQVVVTDRADWSVKQAGFPERYDWAHQH